MIFGWFASGLGGGELIEILTVKIGSMHGGSLEQLVRRLLPRVSKD